MVDTTTVYVFDHASGFDWNIDRAIVEHEREEYRRVGWITADDGLYSIVVPIALVQGVNNEDITEYLIGENWDELGAEVLWRPTADEAQQEV